MLRVADEMSDFQETWAPAAMFRSVTVSKGNWKLQTPIQFSTLDHDFAGAPSNARQDSCAPPEMNGFCSFAGIVYRSSVLLHTEEIQIRPRFLRLLGVVCVHGFVLLPRCKISVTYKILEFIGSDTDFPIACIVHRIF